MFIPFLFTFLPEYLALSSIINYPFVHLFNKYLLLEQTFLFVAWLVCSNLSLVHLAYLYQQIQIPAKGLVSLGVPWKGFAIKICPGLKNKHMILFSLWDMFPGGVGNKAKKLYPVLL